MGISSEGSKFRVLQSFIETVSYGASRKLYINGKRTVNFAPPLLLSAVISPP